MTNAEVFNGYLKDLGVEPRAVVFRPKPDAANITAAILTLARNVESLTEAVKDADEDITRELKVISAEIQHK